MKDVPHHMKKLNRRIIRSQHREEGTIEQDTYTPPHEHPLHQQKKQAKAALTKSRNERVPTHLTEEERNKEMAKRVPVFESLNHDHPKGVRKTRKKTPRI